MNATVDDLFVKAQSLPAEDRALLVERLMSTLRDHQLEVEEAWDVEVERRMEEIESGEVQAIPWEEAKKRLGL